jgi:predicted Zn-dependent protease with MMP-like domain
VKPPTARRIVLSAVLALIVGLGGVSLLLGFSPSYPLQLLQKLAVTLAAIIVLGTVFIVIAQRLAGWSAPATEAEFDRLVERSERLARDDSWGEGDDDLDDEDFDDEEDDLFDPHNEEDFQALVRSALDDLPLEFHRALEHVAVVVSDGGRRRRAYGLYHGDGAARDNFPDRILIYRDTLVRDFGHDREALRAQVTRTVRHEIAHHLGWDEPGVRGLGL